MRLVFAWHFRILKITTTTKILPEQTSTNLTNYFKTAQKHFKPFTDAHIHIHTRDGKIRSKVKDILYCSVLVLVISSVEPITNPWSSFDEIIKLISILNLTLSSRLNSITIIGLEFA